MRTSISNSQGGESALQMIRGGIQNDDMFISNNQQPLTSARSDLQLQVNKAPTDLSIISGGGLNDDSVNMGEVSRDIMTGSEI